jgi:hypothetical protein
VGKIVFGGAMSHVLDPDYYQAVCGEVGRQKITATMEAIAWMGDRFAAARADALIVVADDHMNAFSFNCVPAFCVRIGRKVQRMMQGNAEAFDKVLDHMATEYLLHEDGSSSTGWSAASTSPCSTSPPTSCTRRAATSS